MNITDNPDHMTSAECLAALSRADIEPRPEYKRRVWARYCRLNGFPEPDVGGKSETDPAVLAAGTLSRPALVAAAKEAQVLNEPITGTARGLSFDGFGINGPDEFRSRLATFTTPAAAAMWGPYFEVSPKLAAALGTLNRAVDDAGKDGTHGNLARAQETARELLAELKTALLAAQCSAVSKKFLTAGERT